MRALLFDGNSLQFVANQPCPKPAIGEALIRTSMAGICSTDLEICRGYMRYQGILGHEFAGVVEQVHPSSHAADLVGKRVVGQINASCGDCDLCSGGLASHCRNRTVLGILNRQGCFADHFTLPVKNLIPVPDALRDEIAVFAEPVAAACQILRQVQISPNSHVTVLGDGRLGLLIAQVMARVNPLTRVIGKHPKKLALCEKWGIRHRPLQEIVQRADQEVVIDATGSVEGIKLAMGLVRPRGQIVLKTTVAEHSKIDLSPLVINEVNIIGSRCGPFDEAVALLSSGEIDVQSLVTHRLPIEQGEQAMKLAATADAIKVLLRFD